MSIRRSIKNKKRWVIKVGSALLTSRGQDLNTGLIVRLAEQIAFLRGQGVEVILVSSGSVAAGMGKLGMHNRPERVNELQAAAAVGQATLVRHYEEAFIPHDVSIAQVLLTHADIANRARYLNAKSTLCKLLDLGILSVVNENDTVATEEICFGDNDNLAALVANLVEADLLVILTDQDGLFTADPRYDRTAQLIDEVAAEDPTLLPMASGGATLGRGGMVTKLDAARSASRSAASTIIANGSTEQVLTEIYKGNTIGTLLVASQRLASRKQWMANQMRINGLVTVDSGAARVLQTDGSSLLPVGVTAVEGDFNRGELISCIDQSGKEVARGLSNYSAREAVKLKGQPSDKILDTLGYRGEDELIHRDNMVVL
ncbi:MAG: glutamate 5-kinase [Gammaproteobacteria bacterium]|nr:glutamate 5-kinase [Gammaproteobacteria bacterium]